jgi:hypothetical protein
MRARVDDRPRDDRPAAVTPLLDLAHVAADLAVFWLAVAIYRWAADVPRRFARLVANDRRAALAAALKRCEGLTARVGALSTEVESLRLDLVAARVERAAALVDAKLARKRAERLAAASLAGTADEEDTAPVKRDTERSPPPEDGADDLDELAGEDATLVIRRYKLPPLAPLAVPRLSAAPPHEPAGDDQTPPDGGP